MQSLYDYNRRHNMYLNQKYNVTSPTGSNSVVSNSAASGGKHLGWNRPINRHVAAANAPARWQQTSETPASTSAQLYYTSVNSASSANDPTADDPPSYKSQYRTKKGSNSRRSSTSPSHGNAVDAAPQFHDLDSYRERVYDDGDNGWIVRVVISGALFLFLTIAAFLTGFGPGFKSKICKPACSPWVYQNQSFRNFDLEVWGQLVELQRSGRVALTDEENTRVTGTLVGKFIVFAIELLTGLLAMVFMVVRAMRLSRPKIEAIFCFLSAFLTLPAVGIEIWFASGYAVGTQSRQQDYHTLVTTNGWIGASAMMILNGILWIADGFLSLKICEDYL